MFKDDQTVEAVMYRYKLGLDYVQASREVEMPFPLRPSWRDRFLFHLGNQLIILGSRLQQRHAATPRAGYRPAYPAS